MQFITYLREKDVSAGTAGLTVAVTCGVFGLLFTAIWLAMPFVVE